MHKSGLVLLWLAAACSGPPPAPALLSLERHPLPGGVRLLLVTEPGARISTEYPPTLTLRDGLVVRFDTTAVSEDSAYFAAPPAAVLDRPPGAAHGLLKAGVCRRNERVCRLVKLQV